MTSQEKQGQVIVLAYICLVLLMSVATIAVYMLNVGTQRAGQQGVRLVLSGLLFLFLYQGSKAAKWISVVLFTLAGAMALGLSLVDSLLAVVVGNVMAALYLSFAALLVFSPSVNAFLKYQREDVRREQQAVLDRLRDHAEDERRDDYDDERRDDYDEERRDRF